MPRKLVQKKADRLLLRNFLGLLNRIERRDGKVSLDYAEEDFRSQTIFNSTGVTGITNAVNKLKVRAAELLAKTV